MTRWLTYCQTIVGWSGVTHRPDCRYAPVPVPHGSGLTHARGTTIETTENRPRTCGHCRPVLRRLADVCTCGDGSAEEDRSAVLRCPVHGPGSPDGR